MTSIETFHSWRTRTKATRILLCAFLLGCMAGSQVLQAATLTVRKLGDGSGTVTGPGITCGPDCTNRNFTLPQGSTVTLTGQAAEGSVFLGFMGDLCYGPEACTLTMSSNRTVYAAFGPPDTFAIRYTRPSNGDTHVRLSDQINVYFNRDVTQGPNSAELALLDSEGTPVPFTPVFRSADRQLTFIPSSALAPETTYQVEVPAGAASDLQGNPIETSYSFNFTTGKEWEEPAMYIAVYPSVVMEGSETKVSIWFQTPTPHERTVTLTSTPEGELYHPSEVILEAGQVLAEVEVDSRYNHGSTSPVTVTLSAAEPGMGQQSRQVVVANNTSLTGAHLKFQAGAVISETDQDGVFETGETATVRFDVANFGPSTTSNVILEFSVVDSGISILGGAPYTCYLGSLAAGRNGNCTKQFRAGSDLPTGDYYIHVKGTSGQNGIIDQARIRIVNNSQPDFVLNAGSFPSSELRPGSTVEMTYTARNNGDGFSEQLPLFEVALEGQGTQQLLYRTYANARGYIWESQSFRLPLVVPQVAGTYSIRARINPPGTGQLAESNSTNNDAAVLTLRVGTLYPLSVAKEGSGSGTVTSSPSGIDCGDTCSVDFLSSKVVTLTARPDDGSVFLGWTGSGCSGTGTCVVAMNTGRSVTATFAPASVLGLDYYTVTPCRVLDTRSNGSALLSGVIQVVQVTGFCEIPDGAVAVSLNVTAVAPPSNGYITLFPGDSSSPATSTINFKTGGTQANNAILPLATDASGTLAARSLLVSSGQVHMVLDVNGFFK